MGRCGKQRAPHNENDVSDQIDLEEIVMNGGQEGNHGLGLDIIEQIVALLPEGFEVFVNFEEVDDLDQEGVVMAFPHEDYRHSDEEVYFEDSDAMRQATLKSALVNDDYEENYDWSSEEMDEDLEDNTYQLNWTETGDQFGSLVTDRVLERLSALPLTSGLFYDDPLAQEEIAYEIAELGHLINSEVTRASVDNSLIGIGEEDYKEYCNEMEE